VFVALPKAKAFPVVRNLSNERMNSSDGSPEEE
jgi:hypothetical protein